MTLENIQELARTEHLVLLIQQDSDSHFSFLYQTPAGEDLFSPTNTIDGNDRLQMIESFGDSIIFSTLNAMVEGLTEKEVIELHAQALRELSRMLLSNRYAH